MLVFPASEVSSTIIAEAVFRDGDRTFDN